MTDWKPVMLGFEARGGGITTAFLHLIDLLQNVKEFPIPVNAGRL
jgi:hypothetical protein